MVVTVAVVTLLGIDKTKAVSAEVKDAIAKTFV